MHSIADPAPDMSAADLPDNLGRDKAARQRTIAGSIWFTVPATVAVFAAAYALVPPPSGAMHAVDRLVLAVRWLLIAAIPYATICLAILYLRFAEGAHNPLRGNESEALRIHCRAMQNTLEQLVLFAVCLMVLATYLPPESMRAVPILCVMFAAARFIYWWGYLRGDTLGRAPGVQATFTINIAMLVEALVNFVRGTGGGA